jgi:hypothetical protein
MLRYRTYLQKRSVRLAALFRHRHSVIVISDPTFAENRPLQSAVSRPRLRADCEMGDLQAPADRGCALSDGRRPMCRYGKQCGGMRENSAYRVSCRPFFLAPSYAKIL